ncbi:hypothetical protein KIL84_009781 [Mauremys mutica]|uniref:Uncharacterized protein n=1 Tax=Mauremys mutica TaxID=74926 RepID=A0A9D3XLU2_9SAUR|nr:hypothetical protein KIL84_009781 [Mauremys mutica]
MAGCGEGFDKPRDEKSLKPRNLEQRETAVSGSSVQEDASLDTKGLSLGSQRRHQLPRAHQSELAEDGGDQQQLGEGFSSRNWSATAVKMENTNALSLNSPAPGPATAGSVA